MNLYMKNQIANMITMVKVFEQACQMAAAKDDGTIDKTEIKELKKISAASNQFIKELEKI